MDVSIACVCPGSPHETDTVTLRDRLDFHSVRTIRNEVLILKERRADATDGEVLTTLTEGYLRYGIEAWTLVDERGKAIPVSPEAIEACILPHFDEATTLSDAADDLYAAVLVPLAMRMFLPPTPTGGSTSARTNGRSSHPKRSKRSSTSTSRTVGTGPITSSPAGVSSFSPNSVSVG